MSWLSDAWNKTTSWVNDNWKYVAAGVGAVAAVAAAPFTGGLSLGLIAGGASLGFGIGNAIDTANDNKEAAASQEALANQQAQLAKDQADQTKQEQNIAYQNTIRAARAGEKVSDSNAEQIGEESRKAAVSAFQAESQGAAQGAVSGVNAGTPYMALDASISENNRSIKSWFDGAATSMFNAGVQATNSMQEAGMSYRRSDMQMSLLAAQEDKYRFDASQYAKEASNANWWGNVIGGSLSAITDSIQIYKGLNELFPATPKAASIRGPNSLMSDHSGYGSFSTTDNLPYQNVPLPKMQPLAPSYGPRSKTRGLNISPLAQLF